MAQWPCEGLYHQSAGLKDTMCREHEQHGNFEGYLLPF